MLFEAKGKTIWLREKYFERERNKVWSTDGSETAKGMMVCNIFNKNRHNYFTNMTEFPGNIFLMNRGRSFLLPDTCSILMWHRQVDNGENNAREGQTPFTPGHFPLASPLSSPLVILDPIVTFSLENLLAVHPVVQPLPGSLWTRGSNGSFPSHNLWFLSLYSTSFPVSPSISFCKLRLAEGRLRREWTVT